ncbi:hypothetical protein [Xanthomonas albilineans]|uniref:hypothetical protein n=1 Tax=Xanthomonas albilineans TaxID=29447 RepID=UPI0005F30AE0|nr:hypothetical protein [Xanthomonas albilineans]
MSKHNIHGIVCNVTVHQGANLSEIARGRCIGKVVNMVRAMPAEDFLAVIQEARAARARGHFGGPLGAAMLAKLDDALAANYTKRYCDDFPPIAGVDEV